MMRICITSVIMQPFNLCLHQHCWISNDTCVVCFPSWYLQLRIQYFKSVPASHNNKDFGKKNRMIVDSLPLQAFVELSYSQVTKGKWILSRWLKYPPIYPLYSALGVKCCLHVCKILYVCTYVCVSVYVYIYICTPIYMACYETISQWQYTRQGLTRKEKAYKTGIWRECTEGTLYKGIGIDKIMGSNQIRWSTQEWPTEGQLLAPLLFSAVSKTSTFWSSRSHDSG